MLIVTDFVLKRQVDIYDVVRGHHSVLLIQPRDRCGTLGPLIHCHYNTPCQAMEMVDQGWNLNLVLGILLVILTRAEENSCYYQYSSYVQEETSSFIYLLNGIDTRTSLAPGRPTIHFKE